MEEVEREQYGGSHEAADRYGMTGLHSWHEHSHQETLEEEEEEDQEQEQDARHHSNEEEEEGDRQEEEEVHVTNRQEDVRMREKESKAELSFTYSPIVHGPKWFPTMVRLKIII
jgi:hypothetical protein